MNICLNIYLDIYCHFKWRWMYRTLVIQAIHEYSYEYSSEFDPQMMSIVQNVVKTLSDENPNKQQAIGTLGIDDDAVTTGPARWNTTHNFQSNSTIRMMRHLGIVPTWIFIWIFMNGLNNQSLIYSTPFKMAVNIQMNV